jgi:FkbM family methyltransferase
VELSVVIANLENTRLIRRLDMNALLAIMRRTTIPGRLRLADNLSRLLAPPGGFVLSRLKNGLVMELDLSDRLQRWLYLLGEYEAATIRFIQSFLRPGDTFLDFGANVGWHTLIAARCVGPKEQVLAFEPMPPNVERIRRNLELNEPHNVLIEELALSDSEDKFELSSSYMRSGSATLTPRQSARQRFKVRTIRPDDYPIAMGWNQCA